MTSNPPEIAPKSAADFLAKASSLLTERGQQYDTGKERSGPKIAAAFNAITGKDLTPAEVYLVLQITKDVRQWSAPEYHPDSAEDCVSYAALKAEALADCAPGITFQKGATPDVFVGLSDSPCWYPDSFLEDDRRKSNRRVASGNARVFGVNRRSNVSGGRRAGEWNIPRAEDWTNGSKVLPARWPTEDNNDNED